MDGTDSVAVTVVVVVADSEGAGVSSGFLLQPAVKRRAAATAAAHILILRFTFPMPPNLIQIELYFKYIVFLGVFRVNQLFR